jgi:hypothetical protein
MSAIDYKVKIDESNAIIKNLQDQNTTLERHNVKLEQHNATLDKHNKNLDALNKQHYNLYMETKLKFERLQDELLIFHAEVRGHKINWEDMFYSTPSIGCDYTIGCDYQNEKQSKNKSKERKRSRSI